ncbi:MAG: hypothetical protein JXR96_01185 [Deltaproteobacteria bacterium]|nr:hypothetical protein [Deltaproteobacteria bacterium]
MTACWRVQWFALCLMATACSQGVAMKDGGKAKGKILTVDSGDVGYHVTMELDLEDRAHMVYYDKKNQSLKFVSQSSAGFAISVVDDACERCLYATLKMDGDNEPHLAYYSDSTQTLTYAYRQQGRWKKEPIEWGKGTGMGARLLFDSDQLLHALYYSGDGYLKHAWRVRRSPEEMERLRREALEKARRLDKKAKRKSSTGSAGASTPQLAEPAEGFWGSERVDKANGSEKVQISFVRQPSGRLATSYLHWSGLSSELRIAMQAEDGSWSTEVAAFEDNPGKSSALFFTPGGEPHVVFREARKDRLAMAETSIEGWKAEPLVPDAYNMSIDVDASLNLLVAYEKLSGRDPRKGHLCMAWRRDGSWFRYEVDTARGSGSYLSAGLTNSGTPVIAYFEETNKSLKLFVGE